MRHLALVAMAALALPLAEAQAARAHRRPHTRPAAQAEPAVGAASQGQKTPTPAEANAPSAAQEAAAPPGVDAYSNVPPPSTYDLQQQGVMPPEPRPEDLNFAAENRSLVGQLLRTLAALAGVLALIYLSARLLLPRLKMGKHGKSASMEVLERLNLDGRNALIVVGTKAGGRFVLGCSEAGVQLLERTPANGAYVADHDGILRPQPGASSFGDFLGAEPKSSPDAGRGP